MTLYNTYKHSLLLFVPTNLKWIRIDSENINWKKLLIQLVIPLLIAMSLCNYLGYHFFAFEAAKHTQMHIFSAIATFCLSLTSILLTSLLIRQFAIYDDKKVRFQKAFTLVAFSFVPGIVFNSIAFLFPIINYLTIFSLYSFYILYLGITPILNIPSTKKSGYFTFILIGLLAIYAVLGALFIGIASLLGF
jgi:hypothetical protein